MQKLSEKKRIRKEKKCLNSNSLTRGKEKKRYEISLMVQQKLSEILNQSRKGQEADYLLLFKQANQAIDGSSIYIEDHQGSELKG